MRQRDPIILDAVKAAGGYAALARGLGIKQPAVYQWKRVPAVRVLEVERLTGVSRHDLRPDIYPREERAA